MENIVESHKDHSSVKSLKKNITVSHDFSMKLASVGPNKQDH